jgi:hypothetical protein
VLRRLPSVLGGLCLLLLLAACGGESKSADRVAPGDDARDDSSQTTQVIGGRWRPFHPPASEEPEELTPEQRAEIKRLQTLGYAAGSQKPRSDELIPTYDPDLAYDGLNFFTSGHAPEAILIDMRGELVHRWRRTFDEVWPDGSVDRGDAGDDHWRQGLLLPGGNILVVFGGGIGIAKLDKDSNVIWANGNGAHHEMKVVPSGEIYVLARKAHMIPRVHPTEPILEDFIVVLDPDGHEERRVSLLECFENSEFTELGLRHASEGGDIFHTNALSILPPGRSYPVPWMKPGYVLISMRTPSLLAVVDLDRKTIVHAWQGEFRRQHDPSLTAEGHILLFDNTGLETQSRALEFDLPGMHTVWEYRGTPQTPLASWTCGTAHRLPNGNTLITESDNGHAVEVTHDGRVAWEFYNPYRVVTDQTYIASLFEMHRIDPGYSLDWLKSDGQ